MVDFEILSVKTQIQEENDRAAQRLRGLLASQNVFLVNVMASPGAGKTTFLLRTIEALKSKYRIGVMEADADGDTDAKTIAATGVKVIQLHTGGSCHMDACMTERGIEALGIEDLDIVFLENVGNLVCPAEFDVGANFKVMLLSVPEGDDKPLKYPLMFKVSDVMLINKTDVAEVFDFDFEKAEARAKALNPDIKTLRISAEKGDGIAPWIKLLEDEMEAVKA